MAKEEVKKQAGQLMGKHSPVIEGNLKPNVLELMRIIYEVRIWSITRGLTPTGINEEIAGQLLDGVFHLGRTLNVDAYETYSQLDFKEKMRHAMKVAKDYCG